MTTGRKRQYNHRTTFTTSCEANLLDDFRQTCERQHIDMNALFQEWMTRYVEKNRTLNQRIEDFIAELPNNKPSELPKNTIFHIDLDNHDKPAFVKQIHSLDMKHAGIIQGIGSLLYDTGRTVVNNRKYGIPPTILGTRSKAEG